MVSFSYLKGRFALRIMLLFVLCAIVPLVTLALISFFQVSGQLEENARQRLHHQAVSLGTRVMERIISSSEEMGLMAQRFVVNAGTEAPSLEQGESERFLQMAMISRTDCRQIDVMGQHRSWPRLTDGQLADLGKGYTLVFSMPGRGDASTVFMARDAGNHGGVEYTMIAQVNPAYLLGMNRHDRTYFKPMSVSIMEGGRIIYTTLPAEALEGLAGVFRDQPGVIGNLTWRHEGEVYYAAKAPVFMQSRLQGPLWLVVLSEPRGSIFEPVSQFKTTFALGIVLVFVLVLLLSSTLIRRVLQPLNMLREHTRKISKADFSARVNISSNDEVEELADSFNSMSSMLDQQFKALNTVASIDRAILSELDLGKIIENFLDRIGDICPCDAAGVCFRYLPTDTRWMNQYRFMSDPGKRRLEVLDMDEEAASRLFGHATLRISPEDAAFERIFGRISLKGMEGFQTFPILINDRLMAVVFLGTRDGNAFSDPASLAEVERITDRMAVAFSHAYLVNELNLMNWGTLTALARVVDAKSPWTAGHSERVAALGYRIGQAMGLSSGELDVLNKAGMLHDIGKVSTPRSILDKKDKLTPDEYSIVQEHPANGARILEPLKPYAPTIPIVHQHHERFDGKGYPNGLKGNRICLGARILAVADTYDAMTSDRPYRSGMKHDFVVQEIMQQAGHQFDPDVVEAFLRVMVMQDRQKECA
jgi:putative nucleotidyltransferase with HDIG domain